MKFFEEFSFKFVNVQKHFHIPVQACDGNIFVNDNKNSIAKIQDHKLIHSWTLEHPQCFTCPVIICHESNSFYCAVDDTTMMKWSLNDENLTKSFQFQFQEKIFAVLPLQNRKPVILFSSGRVLPAELLYISSKPIGEDIFEDDQIVWADSFVIHSECKIVSLTVSENENIYKLHELSIKKKEILTHSFQVIANSSHTLKSWCLNKFTFSLVTVWSNGEVLSHSHQNHQPSTLLTLPNVEEDCSFAVAVLDADHLAIAKSSAHKKETVLEMWDLKFKSIKAKKSLKVAAVDCLKMESINSSLFLLFDENLVEVPYSVKKSTLATALGKSSDLTVKSEFSWQEGTVVQMNSDLESSSTQHLTTDGVERMDTDQNTDDLELLAQRFIMEGSSFKSNSHESDLYELLRFALRLKSKSKGISELDPDEILSAVLSSKFREMAMVQYIRKMNLNDTIHSLETILNLLDSQSSNSPSEIQLFNWLILIMKTHTESLLISKDKSKTKLLKKLNQCVSKNIDLYEDYHQAQNMIYMLKKEEKILVNKPVTGKYFSETINI